VLAVLVVLAVLAVLAVLIAVLVVWAAAGVAGGRVDEASARVAGATTPATIIGRTITSSSTSSTGNSSTITGITPITFIGRTVTSSSTSSTGNSSTITGITPITIIGRTVTSKPAERKQIFAANACHIATTLLPKHAGTLCIVRYLITGGVYPSLERFGR
jgi:hypothetical protein